MKNRLTQWIALILCLSGCKDTGMGFVASQNLEAHRVSLGDNIKAIPGQEIVVFAYLTLPANEVVSSEMRGPQGVAVEHGALEPIESLPEGLRGAAATVQSESGFRTIQRIAFTLPVDLTPGVVFELDYQARDVRGTVYRANSQLAVVAKEDAGQLGAYSWDLRLFAEWEQPSNAIPEVSVFDVAATTALMRSLYPSNFPEDQFPFPVLLQPQTKLRVGSQNMAVSCHLPVGSGFCVALEDSFNPDSDKDYDIWFAVRPSEDRLIVEAKGLSGMDAKNATDILLQRIHPNHDRVQVVRYRRRNRAGERYSRRSTSQYAVQNGGVRIRLWADQNTVLEDDKYQWKYVVTFLSPP